MLHRRRHRSLRGHVLSWIAAGVGLGAGLAEAASGDESVASVVFGRDVAPILAARCVTCHQPDKSKGGYQLHTFTAMLRAGRSAEAPVVSGRPADSLMVRLIEAKDPDDRMPQDGEALSSAEIALIRRWIEQGAKPGQINPQALLSSVSPHATQRPPPDHYRTPVPILALAFSGSGDTLASGGYHEVLIRDGATGQLRRRIQNIAQQVQQIAVSPDGRELAVAAGTPGRSGEVKLFELETGRLVRLLATAGDLMTTVAFSPDGRQLAMGGSDNAVRLVNVSSGDQVYRTELNADWVLDLEFRADGRQLVVASRDKTVRTMGVEHGELEQTYANHTGPVFVVGFLGEGKEVFSAGRDRGIHLWQAAEAKKITESQALAAEVLRVARVGEKLFAGLANGDIVECRLSAKKVEFVRTLGNHAQAVGAMAASEKGRRLATAGFDGKIRLWDWESGKVTIEFVAFP